MLATAICGSVAERKRREGQKSGDCLRLLGVACGCMALALRERPNDSAPPEDPRKRAGATSMTEEKDMKQALKTLMLPTTALAFAAMVGCSKSADSSYDSTAATSATPAPAATPTDSATMPSMSPPAATPGTPTTPVDTTLADTSATKTTKTTAKHKKGKKY
jgi:hypothetical protein